MASFISDILDMLRDMSKETYGNARARTKENEGYKVKPYRLTYTKKDGSKVKEPWYTGGYGSKMSNKDHLKYLDLKKNNPGAIPQYWEDLFNERFDESLESAKKITKGGKADPEAIGILAEMGYQMGAGKVKKFTKTISNINKGNYHNAAQEMLYNTDKHGNRSDTDWHNDTPDRANSLSRMMYGLEETPFADLITSA
jgi:GH24 family phage-related lysozyme (muramidase)